MLRRVAGEIAVFALYLLLAIALTWPLASQLSTAVSDLGDPLLNAWILDWTSHALVTQPLHLFDAPIFYPSMKPLAYSEHLTGIALLVLPFHLAGVSAMTLHNIAMLLAFTLSGYGAFVLARMFTRSFPACFIAGIFFAFVSFKFDHLPQVQVVSAGWIPLTLAALVAYWRWPSKKYAALFAAAFVMNGLTNVYYLLFVSAAFGVTLLFLFFAAPRRELRFWTRLAIACVIAALVLLPFLLPYKAVSKAYEMKRYAGEIVTSGWRAWLVAAPRSLLYGPLAREELRLPENSLFPGLLPLFLIGAALMLTPRREGGRQPLLSVQNLRWLDALIVILGIISILSLVTDRLEIAPFGVRLLALRGSDTPIVALLLLFTIRCSIRLPHAFGEGNLRDALARSRFTTEEWMAAMWLLAGFIGSFGMRSFFFSFLFKRIDPFQSIRAAPRFAVIAYTGMAVFVALGAAALIARRKYKLTTAAVLLTLAIFDVMPVIRWESAPDRLPPVYRWIARNRTGPLVEWPIEHGPTFRYLLGAAVHRVPLLNGTSGFEPPEHRGLREAWEQKRFDDLLAQEEKLGAKLLIVHAHWIPAEARGALRNALAQGRLQYLQRFDHAIEGDFVFAIPRNFPQWASLRAPDAPNGAGHFPRQTLERFLNGQPTHSDTPFGVVDWPHWDSTVQGPLTISGWVVAPAHPRHVYVYLDDRRHRFEANRVARPDVNATYGWYYNDKPGYTVTIPARPRGVRRQTDLQVEVVDSTGRVTRLDDIFFNWD
jgi:hypothetical protein